jgi:hypothetical protein
MGMGRRYSDRLTDERHKFNFGRERIFLFTEKSRPVLGPTEPTIHWAPAAWYSMLKRSYREANQSFPSSAKVKKCVKLYLRILMCP